MAAWQEGDDGVAVRYRERLWPGPGPMLLVPLIVLPIAVAYGAALGTAVGVVLAIAFVALGWSWLLGSSPVVSVDERVLRAGRARLPHAARGEVSVLTADDVRVQRSSGDVRTFWLMRPGAARGAVAIDVIDVNDPHPQWIVQTRAPEKLAAALARIDPADPPG